MSLNPTALLTNLMEEKTMELVNRAFDLIERLIAALATLTEVMLRVHEAGSKPAVNIQTMPPTAQPPATPAAQPPAPPVKGPETQVKYEDMERKDLVKLCEERGIEFKPQSRTTTLIKGLYSADKLLEAQAAKQPQEQQAPASQPQEQQAPASQPQEQQAPASQPDPFTAPGVLPPEAQQPSGTMDPLLRPASRDDVLNVLQELQAKSGNVAVFQLLNKYGASNFNNLLPQYNNAVINEARTLLQ
jgi:hypothetical protein